MSSTATTSGPQSGEPGAGARHNPPSGEPGAGARHRGGTAARRIGIRELRQHASVYVDLAERGYTVDITNRGRLVAQLVPVADPESPLERLIAAGIIVPAEEPGNLLGVEPAPPVPAGKPTASKILAKMREKERY
jgi:prevent-host-death family protein